MQTPFDSEQARKRVEEKVASIPPLLDSDIARVPDLEVAGLYAFSVMPRSIGKAGEVIYLVGPNEMLTAGTPADFDSLMSRLEIGKKADVLDMETFARLFLRLRVLRHGEILERPDGHALLRPGQLPARKFAPPLYEFDPGGARFRFWVFDTDLMEPVFWDVKVAPNGETTFTSDNP